MDGLFYSTMGRNIVEGKAAFWKLSLTETIYKDFYGHPPLAMGIQAVFFKLFGDSIYIERFYSLLTLIFSIIFIVLIWFKTAGPKYKEYAWLPLFFYILFPKISWSFSNNMLENTVTVFLLISVYFSIKSLDKYRILMLVLSGFFIFLAFLAKGVTSLFPWSFAFLYYLATKKISIKRAIADTAILVFSTVFFLLVLIMYSDDAYFALSEYMHIQVFNSLEYVQTVDSRLYIIKIFFFQIVIALVFTAILIVKTKNKYSQVIKINEESCGAAFFMILGLSGILPIMVSLKQSAFYIVPALPYIALAFALYLLPYVVQNFNHINTDTKTYKILNYLSILTIIVSVFLTFYFSGKILRDEDILNDSYKIIEQVPHESMISIDTTLKEEWSLIGYLYRYAYISLDTLNKHKYYISIDSLSLDDTVNYKELQLGLKRYKLYINKSQ
ncbi:MAG: glycosyltransferase family 39 protein [Bacteroidales bacterium]|nr:glycosyltransferase family 39 protein [Bacteroidales bacterium]